MTRKGLRKLSLKETSDDLHLASNNILNYSTARTDNQVNRIYQFYKMLNYDEFDKYYGYYDATNSKFDVGFQDEWCVTGYDFKNKYSLFADDDQFAELGWEGSELVTNGGFDTDTDWIKQTGWNISGGSANCDGSQTGNSAILQSNVCIQNKKYKIMFTVLNYSAGNIRIGDAGAIIGTNRNANGTYIEIINWTNANSALYFYGDVNFIGSIDNVSVVEIGDTVEKVLDVSSGCPELANLDDFTPYGSSIVNIADDILELTCPDANMYCYYEKTIDSKIYKISRWVKGNGVNKARTVVYGYNGSYISLQSVVTDNETEWKLVEYELDNTGGLYSKIRVNLQSYPQDAGTVAYLKEFSVKPINDFHNATQATATKQAIRTQYGLLADGVDDEYTVGDIDSVKAIVWKAKFGTFTEELLTLGTGKQLVLQDTIYKYAGDFLGFSIYGSPSTTDFTINAIVFVDKQDADAVKLFTDGTGFGNIEMEYIKFFSDFDPTYNIWDDTEIWNDEEYWYDILELH